MSPALGTLTLVPCRVEATHAGRLSKSLDVTPLIIKKTHKAAEYSSMDAGLQSRAKGFDGFV